MERTKKIFLLIIMVLGTLLFVGCDLISFDTFKEDEESKNSVISLAPDDSNEPTPATTVAPKQKENGSKEISDEKADVTPTITAIQPAETKDLNLYSVNVSSGDTEQIIATIPKDTKITPQLIVEKVVESMADRSLDVGIESVTTDKDSVIVNFYQDKAPLTDAGSVYEASILDAIAMSLMDYLSDYNKVIYRVEGKAYVSGHIELGIDEPYLTK